jgi:hypothetical protein
MLYIVGMDKLILPEAVRPGRHYSFRADMRLNAWAFVALLVAFATRWLLQNHHDWGAGLRSILALSPLVPSALYVRSIVRWIGGMDELQRRIQLEASLFATTGTVFLATALSLLGSGGVLASTRLQHGLGWEGTFAAIVVFYIMGSALFNRRYR